MASNKQPRKILLFADWYEPGYKAGGPIRSCVNFTEHLKAYYQIYIITSNRDHGAAEPYEGIEADCWLQRGETVRICYCSGKGFSPDWIRRQVEEIAPDYIYLNSMFSPRFTIYPLLALRKVRGGVQTMLSPRGMLRESALRFKPAKKKFFLKLFRLLGWHKRVHFIASDDMERRDVQRYFGTNVRVTQIPNLPGSVTESVAGLFKKPGELSMVFVGRVHPIKNLHFLLGVLKDVKAAVRLTIIGNMEDEAFWEKCQAIIRELPVHIVVDYIGERPNHELPAIIREQHIFTLPTLGENFGHAIFEALALGKPVLISDQTPWRGLEAPKAGWDLALDRPDLWREAIERAAGFGQGEYDGWCASTREYIRNYIAKLDIKEAYQKLFS